MELTGARSPVKLARCIAVVTYFVTAVVNDEDI